MILLNPSKADGTLGQRRLGSIKKNCALTSIFEFIWIYDKIDLVSGAPYANYCGFFEYVWVSKYSSICRRSSPRSTKFKKFKVKFMKVN